MSCPPPTFCGYACIMHATAQNKAKRGAKRATPRRRQTRPTKKEPKRKPQNQKESRRGWVRIRDINNPRIHTPPQPRPSVPWPLPGRSGPFSLLYVAIAPLSGSAFHILKLHFCKCIRPLPGIVAANALCSIQMWLCGLHGVRRLQFPNLPSTYGVASSQLTFQELSKQLPSQRLEEVIRLLIAPSGESC